MVHKKASTVIFLIVLISFTGAQLEKKTTTTVTPSTSTETTETTPTTTSSTTTTAPTTTTPTTTTAPTTTTTPPTTPATTTAVPPTPTPVPSPDYRKWSYHDKNDNKTCVIVQLAVQLNLTYVKADNKSSNVLYNLPANDTVVLDGSCGKDEQWITVQWGGKSQMKLQFTANNSQFMLSEFDLFINATDVSTDAKADQSIELYHKHNEFPTSVAMSYHCNKIQTIGFTNTSEGIDVVVNATISHVQFEAFHVQDNENFSTAQDCEAITTSDIVPIAVGCALAGLVIVVLIAYLVGRRRAHARGYLSM